MNSKGSVLSEIKSDREMYCMIALICRLSVINSENSLDLPKVGAVEVGKWVKVAKTFPAINKI